MSKLRSLSFRSLDEAVSEANSLLESGYKQHGEWSLGQICNHLCRVQDPSVDGYPWWLSLFAFLRPVMRWSFLPKLKTGNSPRGIPTAPIFVPPGDLSDADEVSGFAESVARFKAHGESYAPHPAFGKMNPEAFEEIHAAHAAHHLRFLSPRQPDG